MILIVKMIHINTDTPSVDDIDSKKMIHTEMPNIDDTDNKKDDPH